MKPFSSRIQKSIFLLSFSLLSVSFLGAQNDSLPKVKSDFCKKVRFGGGLGGGITNGGFNIALSPTAVYDLNPKASLGVGLNGVYSSTENTKSTVLGGSLIGLYNPIPAFQLSAELEELNVNRKIKNITPVKGDTSTTIKQNYWYPALFLGAGYRSKNITFGLRYDVLYNEEKSIYPNAWMPFARVFF